MKEEGDGGLTEANMAEYPENAAWREGKVSHA